MIGFSKLFKFCIGLMPLSLSWGGDSSASSSSSSSSTSNQTDNSQDKRNVVSDSAVGVTGDNNTVNRNTVSNTLMVDTSNRSQTTTFTDNSDRSTKFTDASNTTTSYTMTDFGSVGASLGLVGNMAGRALDTSGAVTSAALNYLMTSQQKNVDLQKSAFDMVGKSSANALSSASEAMGYAQTAVAGKEQAQKQTSNMMMYAVIGGIGLLAMMYMKK